MYSVLLLLLNTFYIPLNSIAALHSIGNTASPKPDVTDMLRHFGTVKIDFKAEDPKTTFEGEEEEASFVATLQIQQEVERSKR